MSFSGVTLNETVAVSPLFFSPVFVTWNVWATMTGPLPPGCSGFESEMCETSDEIPKTSRNSRSRIASAARIQRRIFIQLILLDESSPASCILFLMSTRDALSAHLLEVGVNGNIVEFDALAEYPHSTRRFRLNPLDTRHADFMFSGSGTLRFIMKSRASELVSGRPDFRWILSIASTNASTSCSGIRTFGSSRDCDVPQISELELDGPESSAPLLSSQLCRKTVWKADEPDVRSKSTLGQNSCASYSSMLARKGSQ